MIRHFKYKIYLIENIFIYDRSFNSYELDSNQVNLINYEDIKKIRYEEYEKII